MKTIILTILTVLCVLTNSLAQRRLMDKAGVASFYSEAPLEDIEATNKSVLGAMDLDKGAIAVSMMIRDFHFEQSLMEEHFNENYMESEKFPKATFAGSLKDFSSLDFSSTGRLEATAEGEIVIHGVKQPLITQVIFEVTATQIKVQTRFNLEVEEFDIEVPTLVIKNIAEVVEVNAMFNFKK